MTPQLAQENHLGTERGVIIAGFVRGSAAARAGLQRFDIITKLNGTEIREIDQLQRLVAALPIGGTASVEALRDSHTLKFEIPVSLMVPRQR